MDAIVNFVLATSVSAMVVCSWLPPEYDEMEYTSIRDTVAVKAICTRIKCQGDFPVSSIRQYADAKQGARGTEARRFERQTLIAQE
jgi:hypothetical protein